MDDRKLALRIFLVGLVIVSALPLFSGCGVTSWQRSQDAIGAALAQARSPEFVRAVEEARK